MIKKAFTLIELVFVMVVIGILAAMALPKFRGFSSNAKISSELATASTIQSALEDIHSDWIVSEGSLQWGNNRTSSDLNANGYPKKLGECPPAFNWILKNSSTLERVWQCQVQEGIFIYRGPASNPQKGAPENGKGRPDKNDCWIYEPNKGLFRLSEGCTG